MSTGRWKVEPAAARAVLSDAEAKAEAFEQAVKTLAGAIETATGASPGPKTAAALSSLSADPFEIQILAAQTHAKDAVSGVRGAIAAYEHGDLDMAATSEQKAIDE